MNVHFCPNCGSTDIHPQNITNFKCGACGYVVWNNPKTATAVVFVRDGQVLTSERGIEPNKGKYDLPGGFVEYGEDPYTAAIREIREETGVRVTKSALRLLTAYTHEYLPGVSVTDLVFVAEEWTGEFPPQDDSASLAWQPLSFLHDARFAPPYHDLAELLQPFAITKPVPHLVSALQ